ncbi:MAG: HNH endonuclease [Candidatus Neomarinimicrobiota bacterium]
MAPKLKELKSKKCIICGKVFYQKRYSSGPDHSFYKRKYCSCKCFGKSIIVSEDAKTRRRKRVLAAYGGKCACCGETEWKFLSLDHVDNDGAEHRRKIGQSRIYEWAEDNGYPDNLQLLCYNCNMAKAFYGKCPHQE